MELALTLDSDLSQPLHRQIYEQIRDRILNGQLARSQRLPPSRALAQSLQVSRATVSLSYDQLLSEGYLETRPGAGTFVAAQLPEALLQVEGHPSAPALEAIPLGLSRYGQAIAQAPPWQNQPAAPYNFRYGHPSLDPFPLALWKRLMAQEMSAHRHWMDYATDPLGYGPLREAIAQYLTRARAVACHPDQIVITHGTQQALQLGTQLFVDPGEAIALENPGYLGAQRIFHSRGAQLQPIPVDGDGILVEALAQLNPTPKLVYVTPSHQFPTGALLSLARRLHSDLCDQAVVDRAAQAGVYLASLQAHNLHPCQGDFILGYTEIDETQIEIGIQRWAKTLQADY